jgi:glutathione S-transferase
MYKLYSLAGSCSTGITILLEKLGVDYEVIQRNDVENYSDIVATNQVPALVDNDMVIAEGAAIALYLLEKHCDVFTTMKLQHKAKFYQKLMFNYATLHPAYAKIMTVSRVSKDKDIKLMQKLADKVSDLWVMIDNDLATNEFMFENQPTIIDYLLTIYTTWGKYVPEVDIKIGSNVHRLANQISQTPEFKAAYKKENITF